ncbi:uncharacterized protein LOC135493468 [Lineus longissimus]|uniref:uncharacterized protein LOC135493468 n=1 Tax=Lineus longissimus TaxID=88925 RepID=UPI002B4D30FB
MASNVRIQMEATISAVDETPETPPTNTTPVSDSHGESQSACMKCLVKLLVPVTEDEKEEESLASPSEDVLLPREQVNFDEVTMRYYLTPYLLFVENQERILNDKHEHMHKTDRKKLASDHLISAEVSTIIKELTQYLNEEGSMMFRGGELKRCGSVEEGTKVSSCDEFDFQYLISLNNYRATRKPLLRTKPRSSGETTKSFFSLAVAEINDADEAIQTELLPKDVHTQFKDEVGNGLSKQDLKYGHLLKKAGPAVKIVLWKKTRYGKPECFVKIDLTLGIRADVDKLFEKEELTPLASALPWNLTLKCHFVCAHNYWKISFVETEQELMRKICEEDVFKMTCYRAIKCVRDKVDIKDPYGDGILPSYPIKMTFMDIALKDCQDGVKWHMEDLGKHVIHVLKEVEGRGQGHRLKCPFLLGDDVMGEADRSYLESRRVLKKLKESEGVYVSQQSTLFPILIAFSLLSYYMFLWCYMYLEDGDTIPRSDNNIPVKPYLLACYVSGQSSVFTLACQLLVCILFFLKKRGNREIHPLYRIYYIIPFIELLYFIVGFILEMLFLGYGSWRYDPLLLPVDVPVFTVSSCKSHAFVLSILVQFFINSPLLFSGITISANAIFSIALEKNLRLFHTYLTFPGGGWRWRAPDGNRYEFLPEVCGREGFQGFTKARAYIVAILTPLAVFLTIVIPAYYTTVDSYTDFPRIHHACILQGVLLVILVLLLIQQIIGSRSWSNHWEVICESRINSCGNAAFCYFFPYIFCPNWEALKDDLRTKA